MAGTFDSSAKSPGPKTYGLFGRESVIDMVHAKDESGPNDRVERDVVFTEEIQVSGCGTIIINAPPAFPRVCAIGQHVGMLFRPNSSARGVTLDGFKPDVDAFASPFIALNRDGDSHSRSLDCPWAQPHVKPLLGHGLDV